MPTGGNGHVIYMAASTMYSWNGHKELQRVLHHAYVVMKLQSKWPNMGEKITNQVMQYLHH